jgi:hypothetical protein
MKFLRNRIADPLSIFIAGHFYFDKMKLFMIESESLLERKFRGAPEKKIAVGKKVVDSRD